MSLIYKDITPREELHQTISKLRTKNDELSALCRRLAEACESFSAIFALWLKICEEKDMGCTSLSHGKSLCDAILADARKAGMLKE